MNEHREIDYYDITDEHGIIISFKDGSHTYIDPEMTAHILDDILIWNCYEEE